MSQPVPGEALKVLRESPLERQEEGADGGSMGQRVELSSSNIKGDAALNTASQDALMDFFFVIHEKRVAILTTLKSSYFDEFMNDA